VLESAPKNVDEAWLKGFQLTLQQLDELLAAQGVVPIEALGRPFDPSQHEAIGHEESDEHPEDTVVSEVRKGYRLHDRVVRPALVRVARPVGD
jgi:molecular chaperone GrpE